MKIKIDMPTGAAVIKLQAVPKLQRVALADAMNTSVKQAEVDIVGAMRRVFDRPTPWALGGVTHDKATPNDLDAVVRVRGKTGAAVPAESFLKAEIEGGQRRFKRFEVALYKAGVLPAGYYAVPASGARMDAYGNMSSGHIVQLLAYFQAFPPDATGRRRNTSAERRAEMAERRRTGYAYVAIRPGNRNLYPGIYEYRNLGALGTGVRAVMIFVRRAAYSKRLPFFETAEQTIDRVLPSRYTIEMGNALGSGGDLR